jgi:hypothetical protein
MIGAILMLSGITAVAWIGYWLHRRAVRAEEAEQKSPR